MAAKNCPPEPNRLCPGDVWGGIAELGDDQVGVYLFFNGGRDLLGRPGRFVLLATLLERKEVQDRDLSAIFRCTVVQWVSEKAPTNCPLPSPPSLHEDLELPRSRVDPGLTGLILTQPKYEFARDDSVERAAGIFCRLPLGRSWRCDIQSAQYLEGQICIYQDLPYPVRPETPGKPPDAGQSEPLPTHVPPSIPPFYRRMVERIPERVQRELVLLAVLILVCIWQYMPKVSILLVRLIGGALLIILALCVLLSRRKMRSRRSQDPNQCPETPGAWGPTQRRP